MKRLLDFINPPQKIWCQLDKLQVSIHFSIKTTHIKVFFSNDLVFYFQKAFLIDTTNHDIELRPIKNWLGYMDTRLNMAR